MVSCAFFGHRSFNYSPYREKLNNIITDLIENHGVTQFYNGFRGEFDCLCATIVSELKYQYPNIRNIMVLSYYPSVSFTIPKYFDDCVYLLEKSVPPKSAIPRTNEKIVERADYIISGVKNQNGGAWTACQYAIRCHKLIFNIFNLQ
ncbi:MAG: hypothetical protein J1G07_06460 [Clostridiales bacterium]|nr:hypothetical protein [Clostridiales bacterium]